MSKYHAVSSGVITKAALPAITRQRGTTTGPANLMLYGAGKTTVSNNTTFIDSSANAFTVTRNGDTVQSGFNPFSQASAGAGYFDGTGDYLSLPANAAFDFGTGDWTVEAWVYIAANSNQVTDLTRPSGIFATSSTSSWGFVFHIAGNTTTTGTGLSIYNGSLSYSANTTITQQVWHHVACCRSGSNVYFFLDGVQVGATQTITGSWGSSTLTPTAGGSLNTNNLMVPNGYISNVRVVKGTAVYTSNFTPSTSPLTAISGTSLLLLMDNYSIVNSTSTNTPVTINTGASISTAQFPTGMSSSMSFNGTTGYLSFPTFSGFTLGAAAFTLEFFVNSPTVASNTCIIDTRSAVGAAGYFVSINTSQQIVFNYISNYTSTTTLTANTWTHVAIVRVGSTVQMYINGVAESGTFTSSATITAQACNIGQKSNTASVLVNFGGYLSNMRVVQGTALYTSNFTPPSLPMSTTVTVPAYVTNNIYGVNQIP